MSDAILGGLVTGGFALLVLVLTLRHATKQAERSELARIRERRAERLRDAYRALVAAAYAMEGHAAVLGIAYVMRRQGEGSHFTNMLSAQQADTKDQHAALRLEDDADQKILSAYSALSMEHTSFLALLEKCLREDKDIPNGEYEQRITRMYGWADNIAKLAKDRLAELEKPQPSS